VLEADLGTDPVLWAATAPPGTVLKATANGVAVKAGEGHIVLRRLEHDGQPLPAALVVGMAGGEGARDRFC
jgi:methionyl-tRNA formyltransferase